MKLLIVDDEIFAIKGILDSVDWTRLKFDEVLTAGSYSQAVNLMRQNEIAVLLCDIEMPMGSGLELVQWAQDHSPDTLCIILSCHDEFSMAQQALRLNCLDYLLKPPVPQMVTAALEHAKTVYQQNREKKRYLDYGKLYVSGGKKAEEQSEIPPAGAAGGTRTDVVSAVEEYIRAHIDEQLTVEGLAALVYVNPEYLSRLFKKKHHKTLVEYITAERMELAAGMLRNSRMTVSSVSARVGYPNYSYFTRIFKKYFGVTPREYQQGEGGKPF